MIMKLRLTGMADVHQHEDDVTDVASHLFAEHRLLYLHSTGKLKDNELLQNAIV